MVGVDIVDCNLVSKLGDEILVYEVIGQFLGVGIDVVDVVILFVIYNVDIVKCFLVVCNWIDDDGDCYYILLSCFYEVMVLGNVKFFELFDFNEIEVLIFKGIVLNIMLINNLFCLVSQDLVYSFVL